MKTGLVLEGGAMRGLFSAGVMDVLMENNVAFNGAIGVSAGAAFGCNYKSRQIGRVIRYNTRFARHWRYCSFRSLLFTGDLYGADFCYRELPETLDRFDDVTYESNPMAFYAVCTDVDTGKAIYHRCYEAFGEDIQWVRASASMPLASRAVRIGDKKLLDGGIADSIPLRAFEEMGYTKNVVILTQPEGYVKQPMSHKKLLHLALHRMPQIYTQLIRRHETYNTATAYVKAREEAGAALVIRPEKALAIGHISHDPAAMQAVYQLGREAGSKHLAAVRAFLQP